MVKGGKVIYVRSQISSAGVAAVRCFRGHRLGRSETYVVLQAAGSEPRESGEHTPEAVEAWVGQLCQRFASGPIAVAIEQSRGALVFLLRKYESLHRFPVPAQMSASMRQARYPSGAKDDPRDADLRLDRLVQQGHKLRRLSPDSEATRRLQNLVEERRQLVAEKTAQSNRLTNRWKIYFPQILDWFELDRELARGLLEGWPRREELQKVPPSRLRAFLRKHHGRDQEGIEQQIHRAIPAIRDGGDSGQEHGGESDR